MFTVAARTCTTAGEGRKLYAHFLACFLSTIQIQERNCKMEISEAKKNETKRVIGDTLAQFIGYLYMIMRRMCLNGRGDVATEMKQIIDMIIDQDLGDPRACDAIHTKFFELSVRWWD